MAKKHSSGFLQRQESKAGEEEEVVGLEVS